MTHLSPEHATTEHPDVRTLAGSELPTLTLLHQLGAGGLVASAIPAVAFVVVNPLAGLQPAICASLGVALALGVWRRLRRRPLKPAVSGLLGAAICAFIAYRTGEARGYFLYGIWLNLLTGLTLLLSVVVRRPLVGVVGSVLTSSGPGWRADPRARFGFDAATMVWAVFMLSRFGVQRYLYDLQQTGWLAVARLVMGLPLTAVAALVSIWAIRRAVRVTALGSGDGLGSGTTQCRPHVGLHLRGSDEEQLIPSLEGVVALRNDHPTITQDGDQRGVGR
jgi:hypothetical protein